MLVLQALLEAGEALLETRGLVVRPRRFAQDPLDRAPRPEQPKVDPGQAAEAFPLRFEPRGDLGAAELLLQDGPAALGQEPVAPLVLVIELDDQPLEPRLPLPLRVGLAQGRHQPLEAGMRRDNAQVR